MRAPKGLPTIIGEGRSVR